MPVEHQLGAGPLQYATQHGPIGKRLAPAHGASGDRVMQQDHTHLSRAAFRIQDLFEARQLVGSEAAAREQRQGR